MIAFVKGFIDEIGEDYIIVDNNDMGYMVLMPSREIERLKSNKEKVKIYTHHYVREDQMGLFGFLDKENLKMFKMLINVSGVGPKGALSILSALSASEIALSVITGDEKTLCTAPGVGKKTAQRMILELKDKLKNYQLVKSNEYEEINLIPNDSFEAVSALMALGYTKQESEGAVSKVYKQNMSVETAVKEALKVLMKG